MLAKRRVSFTIVSWLFSPYNSTLFFHCSYAFFGLATAPREELLAYKSVRDS